MYDRADTLYSSFVRELEFILYNAEEDSVDPEYYRRIRDVYILLLKKDSVEALGSREGSWDVEYQLIYFRRCGVIRV